MSAAQDFSCLLTDGSYRVSPALHDEVEEVHDRGCSGGNVSHRGGGEHRARTAGVLLGNNAQLVQLPERTPAGVELDGQGHEVEDPGGTEEDEAEVEQEVRATAKEEAEYGQHGTPLAADARDGKQGGAPLQRRVGAGMLDGVTDLVGGDGHSGDAC